MIIVIIQIIKILLSIKIIIIDNGRKTTAISARGSVVVRKFVWSRIVKRGTDYLGIERYGKLISG